MLVTVIPPDSAGSKGDEALMRGLFRVFRGCSFRVLTTERADRSWRTELPDICGSFEEIIVPFTGISQYVHGGVLAVVGADVMDGTCGPEAALARVDALRNCVSAGGRAYVFMSFRSDADAYVVDAIKGLPPGIVVLPRFPLGFEFQGADRYRMRYLPRPGVLLPCT